MAVTGMPADKPIVRVSITPAEKPTPRMVSSWTEFWRRLMTGASEGQGAARGK